jgi:hypothetical protein
VRKNRAIRPSRQRKKASSSLPLPIVKAPEAAEQPRMIVGVSSFGDAASKTTTLSFLSLSSIQKIPYHANSDKA